MHKSKRKSPKRKSPKRKSPKRKSPKRKSPKSFKKIKGCFISSQSKYRTRPGPPYPAQECKNSIKLGNDNLYYKSKPDKNGIYKWVKIKET